MPLRMNLIKIISLLAFLIVGISGSVWLGNRLQQDAQAKWLDAAKSDTDHLTGTILTRISEAETALRAIAGRLDHRPQPTKNDFIDQINDIDSWDLHIKFDAVAYAERIPRSERLAFEKSSGENITVVGNPKENAPDSFESYVVRLSSKKTDILRRNADLVTHPAMKAVVETAHRVPKQVILGPIFAGAQGKQFALIATAITFSDGAGVLVATLNLSDIFSYFAKKNIPSGLQLRILQRDSDAATENKFRPVFGALTAPPGVTTQVIRLVRGQAKWDLNWDILPDYRGGPKARLSLPIQFGGSILTVLIFIQISFLVLQNARIALVVEQRTAEVIRQTITLQLTLDTINQGFVVWDADHQLVAWSKRCLDFWYEPGDILEPGMPMINLLAHIARKGGFGPGDPDELANAKFASFTGPEIELSEEFKMNDGKIIDLRRYGLPSGGHVTTYTDITDRRRAERDLEENRSLMQSLADNLPVFVSLKDAEGRFLFVNKVFEEQVGVTLDDVIGKTVYDIFPKDLADDFAAEDRKIISSGAVSSREVDLPYPDGKTRTVIRTRFPILSTDNEVIGLGGINYDISERKKSEKALMESQARFKSFIDNAPAKIVFKDIDGRYTLVNRAYERRYGVTLGQILGKTAHEVHTDEVFDYTTGFDQEVLETGAIVRREIELPNGDGELLADIETRFPITDAEGRIVGIGSIAIDVSERRAAEKALKNAHDTLEANVAERTRELLQATEEAEYSSRTKSAFLANMSHELRTPLNAVIGFSEMIQSESLGPLGNTSYKSYIDLIHQSGNHLASLIGDILDISRIDSGVEEPANDDIDVVKTVMLTTKMVLRRAEESHVELSTQIEPDLPHIIADGRRLKQILLNLLDNAVKFTPSHGRVVISAIVDDDGGMTFRVVDSGIGIAEGDIDRVLMPFHQVEDVMIRSRGGSGLGLSITKSLVELHGGQLTIDSQVDKGTTVTVHLPPDRTAPATAPTSTPANTPANIPVT